MTGKIIGGALMTLAAVLSAFLGLMFAAASAGSGSRLITGVILIAAGAVLLAFGIRLLRKGVKGRPDSLRRVILACAAKYNGRVTEDVLFAETGNRELAEAELANLIREGRAKSGPERVGAASADGARRGEKGGRVYVFPEFMFELKMKVCPYCGKDLPLRETVETCPSCGGDLKIVSVKTAGGEDKFSMDE